MDFQGLCENLELNEKNRADYCLTGFGHGKTESRPSIQLRNWTASGWSMAWQTSEIAPMTSRWRGYFAAYRRVASRANLRRAAFANRTMVA